MTVHGGVPGVRFVIMGRTNIEIDDGLIERAMKLHGLSTKRAAVDLALRQLVGAPMSREEALDMEGSGWAGELADLRRPDRVETL